MSAFTVGDRVDGGAGRTGTVVPHEHLAAWCRPVATGLLGRPLLALASWLRPRPAPPPLVPDGRVYDDAVPVAWDDGSVSVTRAHLLYHLSPARLAGVRRA